MRPAELELERVTVRYERHGAAVLDGVSFAVGEGERVALVGLNGSGKTTLLMAAVGLAAHEGEIRVGGISLSRRTVQEVRERVGFLFNVPEDQLLFPTALEDVAFGLLRKGTSGRDARERARAMLDALGVGQLAQEPLHHLSHGQKQRVALAGALVTEPSLLLLDEPSAALDPRATRGLWRLLREQRAAMVVATHDLGFAEELCTRYVVLEGGRVSFDGGDGARVRELVEGEAER